MTGDGNERRARPGQADVGVAMNTGTRPRRNGTMSSRMHPPNYSPRRWTMLQFITPRRADTLQHFDDLDGE